MKIFSFSLGIVLFCVSPLILAHTYTPKKVTLVNNTICHVINKGGHIKIVKGKPVTLISYKKDEETQADPPIKSGGTGDATAYYNARFKSWILFLGSPSDGVPVGSTPVTTRKYVYYFDASGTPFFSFSNTPCPYQH